MLGSIFKAQSSSLFGAQSWTGADLGGLILPNGAKFLRLCYSASTPDRVNSSKTKWRRAIRSPWRDRVLFRGDICYL